MSAPTDNPSDVAQPRPGLVRRNVVWMAAGAAATIIVQIAILAAAKAALAPPAATAGSLLLGMLWVVLLAPFLAAGGEGLDGLFRAGTVLDASAVVLVVLVVAGDLTLWGAVMIYLVWSAIGLAGCTLVLTARRAENRLFLAAAAVLVLVALAAGPFWANGIVLAARGEVRQAVKFVVRAASPVFAVSECLPPTGRFVWNQQPILYKCTALARDAPMPAAGWYVTAGGYAVISGALGCLAGLRRRR